MFPPLPCDHGVIFFTSAYYAKIQSIINQSINTSPRHNRPEKFHRKHLEYYFTCLTFGRFLYRSMDV